MAARMAVKKTEAGWMLLEDGLPAHPTSFTSALKARQYAWSMFGEVAELHVEGKQLKDLRNPVHLALATIEARHGNAEILFFTPTHYYIRRSRLGAEEAIRYRVKGDTVKARNDSELLLAAE